MSPRASDWRVRQLKGSPVEEGERLWQPGGDAGGGGFQLDERQK